MLKQHLLPQQKKPEGIVEEGGDTEEGEVFSKNDKIMKGGVLNARI